MKKCQLLNKDLPPWRSLDSRSEWNYIRLIQLKSLSESQHLEITVSVDLYSTFYYVKLKKDIDIIIFCFVRGGKG
jgi:hypothetical protein